MLGFCARLLRLVAVAHVRRDRAGYEFARRLLWECNARLRHFEGAGPLRLPVVELADLIGDVELSLSTAALRSEDGGVSPLESFCLAALVRHCTPRRIFEIGTFRGRTTCLLAEHAPPNAEVLTLDLPPDQVSAMPVPPAGGDLRYIAKPRIGECFANAPVCQRITQLLGDSRTFDFAPYRRTCDFVFVDGAHSYPFVAADTATAFELIRPGGVIVWHDYKSGCPGVVRALHTAAREHPLVALRGTSLAVYGLAAAAECRPAQR